MRKDDTKKFAKTILKFIDDEIKQARLMESRKINEDSSDALQKDYTSLFGRDTGMPSSPLPNVPRKELPPIDKNMWSIFAKDNDSQGLFNHALLQESIDLNYMRRNNEGKLDPKPLLIWGAPGIGKSQGVKRGSIDCARKICDEKNEERASKGLPPLTFKQVKLDSDEFSKPREELAKNYYFVEWNITDKNFKDELMFGPVTLVGGEEGRAKERAYMHNQRIPTENLFIFFDVRIAGIAEQDILGMPSRVDMKVIYKDAYNNTDLVSLPAIAIERLPFLKLCTERKDLHGVIMWDEINQGSDGMQAALYQIVLDKKVGDATLAPGIGQFAAANGKVWGGRPLLPALGNRFASAYLWLSPEEWLEEFKDVLENPIKEFILKNPKIGMYISDPGWNEVYLPYRRAKGNEEIDMDTYIQSSGAGGGRWPSPRDLLDFNSALKDLFRRQQKEKWANDVVADKAFLLATQYVGAVWAKHFYDYMYRELSIKWETLVNDRDAAIEASGNSKKQQGVRSLIVDHLKNAIELSKNKYNVALYKKECHDLIRVFLNVSSAHMDFIMTPISAVLEEVVEKQAEYERGSKTSAPPESRDKTMERIKFILTDGAKSLPPDRQDEAKDFLMTMAKLLTGTAHSFGKSPTQAATSNISIPQKNTGTTSQINKPTALTPNKTVPSFLSGGIPPSILDNESNKMDTKKFVSFRKLFEEIDTTFTATSASNENMDNSSSLIEKQKKSMQRISEQVKQKVESLSAQKVPIKEHDRILKDTINKEIMNDNILTREQKQHLVSVIKNAPNALNIICILNAYIVARNFKL
ncbi:MAG: hypothetical protein PHS54_00330 [Clostridia bacterium]|nr:hypothetical protein [Clostridia bacterium]